MNSGPLWINLPFADLPFADFGNAATEHLRLGMNYFTDLKVFDQVAENEILTLTLWKTRNHSLYQKLAGRCTILPNS